MPPPTRAIVAPPIGAHPCVPVSNDELPTRLPSTLTATDFVAVAPPESVTSTLAVQFPAAYVCVAVVPGCGPTTVPSPKSKQIGRAARSGTEEREAWALPL